MKKKRLDDYTSSLCWRKKFLVMRLAYILMVGLVVLVPTSVSAQGKMVSLDIRSETLSGVLMKIKDQTGVNILYNENVLRDVPCKDMKLEKVTVEDALNRIFEGTRFSYEVSRGVIVVRERKANESQQKSVKMSGVVTDEKGEPLPGVTVLIKGTSSGAATDIDGKFSFSIPAGKHTLQFSMVGMESKEIMVDGNKEMAKLTVVLKPAENELEDVVVTGIFKKSRESFTGAVSTITEKELKSFRGRNLLSTLKNIDPTFNIIEDNTYGSDPNHLPEVQIRGTSSLPTVEDLKNETKTSSLNTPLIILDGFEISLQRMLDLNDEDISSVTLLKDGSATAIYGSRGANGVVVIESKRPEVGKLRLSYRGSLNVEIPDLTDYDLLDAREKLQLEVDAGLYEGNFSNETMRLQERYTKVKEAVESGVDTYWLSKPLRTGVGHKHNLRLEGGGEGGFRYSASVQYNDVKGVMKGSNRETFNGNVDLVYELGSLLFRNSLEVGLSESNESSYGSFDQYVKLNPYWTGVDENGKVVKELEETNDLFNPGPANPLYDATLDLVNQTTTTTITDNFAIEWRPLKNMTLRSRIGLTKTLSNGDNFKPAEHSDFKDYTDDQIFRKGKYIYSSDKGFSYDWDITLSYSKTFGDKHELYAGLNYNLAQSESKSYTFTMEGFPQANLKMLSMALQYEKDGKPSGSESVKRRLGVTGNVNYIYDKRYFADISYRVDGASDFGSDKRFAPFYSFGLGWNINQEKFMEGIAWLDRLKLRASYAVTGAVNFSAYQALASYEYFTGDRYRYWFGSELMGLANEDLTWQQTDKWNVGLELAFLNNRLRVTADYYRNTTDNLLSEMYLPLANGFSSYTANIGEVRNTGVELSASGFLIRNTEKNIIWSLSASMIHEKNEIVKISDALKAENEELEAAGGSNPNFLYREGEALRTLYVVPSLGIDPSTGKELYVNRFGELTYVWDARDKQACGVQDPKFRGNINTMFTWKDLSVNLSFAYRFGGYAYNSTLIDRVENADVKYNVDRRVYKDRWREPGDHTFFKDVKDKTATQMTSRFVQKENTLECQSAQVKYDFSQNWIKQYLGMQHFSVAFNMDNLFRISTIKQERGIAYPFSRRFSFSLSAIF